MNRFLYASMASLLIFGAAAPTLAQAPAAGTFELNVTLRGAEAKPYITLKSTGASARDVIRDIGTKAGLKVMFSPSAGGTVTGEVPSKPAEEALPAVAALAGMSVRIITLPKGTTAAMAPDDAARAVDVLASLPLNVSVTDPASGRALTLAANSASPEFSDVETVYYIQGRLSPQQERANPDRRVAERPAPAGPQAAIGDQPNPQDQAVARGPVQSLVSQTVEQFKNLPLDMKMQMMGRMQREMRRSLTDQERQQLRLQWQQQRQQNGGNNGRRDRRR